MTSTLSHRATLLAVSAAALMWGLYWIPVRALESTGLSGVVAAYAVVLGIAPAILWRVTSSRLALNRRHIIGAIAIGAAISLYGAALNFTEVTRAVLLFYLAPAWSILIECRWFGRRLDKRTFLALSLFAAGLVVIVNPFSANEALSSHINAGDLIALIAGVFWSSGAAIVFSSDATDAIDLGIAANGFAILVAGSVAFIAPGDMVWSEVNLTLASIYAILAGCLYILPVTIITFIGASRLPPATVTFLLSAEILSGVISSSIWLAEAFTLREGLGTLLVILGVMVEIHRHTLTATHDHCAGQAEREN